MEAAHKGLAHISVLAMALYLRNVQHILLHIALHHAVYHRQLHIPAIGEGHVGQRIHHQRLHLLSACRGMDLEAVCRDGVLQMHGVQHTGLMLCRLIVYQQLAVVRNLAAAGKGGQHAEILRTGGDIDVRPASGGQSADLPIQIERPCAVDSNHLNSLDKVQSHAQRRAQRVVQMAPLLQVHRVQVVGNDADHGGVQMIFHHGLQQYRHIPRSAALAHHQVAAVAQPLKHILFAEGLVVGGYAGGDAGAHSRAVHIRQMALQRLAGHRQRCVKGLQQIGEARRDIGANTLGQAHRIRTLQSLADDLRIKASAAGLQIGRKRHMGRHHEIDFQVCGLRLFQDGLDALQPGHHAHLMQVCHDAGGAVCQHRFGKGTDCQ